MSKLACDASWCHFNTWGLGWRAIFQTGSFSSPLTSFVLTSLLNNFLVSVVRSEIDCSTFLGNIFAVWQEATSQSVVSRLAWLLVKKKSAKMLNFSFKILNYSRFYCLRVSCVASSQSFSFKWAIIWSKKQFRNRGMRSLKHKCTKLLGYICSLHCNCLLPFKQGMSNFLCLLHQTHDNWFTKQRCRPVCVKTILCSDWLHIV